MYYSVKAWDTFQRKWKVRWPTDFWTGWSIHASHSC